MIETIAPYVGHVIIWAAIACGVVGVCALMFLGVVFLLMMRDIGGRGWR